MTRTIYVTGTGIISAIGNNTEEVLASLLTKRSGIGEITLFKTSHKGKLPLAEVKKQNEALQEMTGHSWRRDLTRTTMLGMIAASEAINNAGINHIRERTTGLISATTVGGMDRSENFYPLFLDDPRKGKLMDIVNHDCGDSTERIAHFLGIRDFLTTISTACSSSANAIMLGARMIRAGLLDRVVAGGTDSVTRFTLNGFNTLMIIDKTGCHPFDENRAGLTIGEGAAFLVLESDESVRRSKKKPLAILSGYGNANDAYHQTASSPEGTGACLAMEKALALAGIGAKEISYINAHGTGTQNNDLSEGIAIEKIFGNRVPPFSSTKSYTGHTLGAAGSFEAVISILAICNRTIFPNLNWSTPMKELSIRPVTEMIHDTPIRHVLSNSFGFGGNNTTLIFSEVDDRLH